MVVELIAWNENQSKKKQKKGTYIFQKQYKATEWGVVGVTKYTIILDEKIQAVRRYHQDLGLQEGTDTFTCSVVHCLSITSESTRSRMLVSPAQHGYINDFLVPLKFEWFIFNFFFFFFFFTKDNPHLTLENYNQGGGTTCCLAIVAMVLRGCVRVSQRRHTEADMRAPVLLLLTIVSNICHTACRGQIRPQDMRDAPDQAMAEAHLPVDVEFKWAGSSGVSFGERVIYALIPQTWTAQPVREQQSWSIRIWCKPCGAQTAPRRRNSVVH